MGDMVTYSLHPWAGQVVTRLLLHQLSKVIDPTETESNFHFKKLYKYTDGKKNICNSPKQEAVLDVLHPVSC